MKKDAPTLEKAINDNDYDKLVETAHGLKGASANLSAVRFEQLFKQLEQMGRDENLQETDGLMQAVKQSVNELEEYLKTF
ncbi:MAG: hypothetical protein GF313_16260 [Caldithrix sp.]|nr:hypothetical protein [Caldithrix sp.]